MTDEDVPEIVRQEKDIFSSPWSEESFRTILSEQSISLCLVGTVGGVLAAYAMCYVVPPELYIANIAVAREFRRLHIGTAVMRELLQRSEPRNCNTALLEVRASNAGAIRLYEQFGFEVAGVRKNYYENGEDALMMNLIFS